MSRMVQALKQLDHGVLTTPPTVQSLPTAAEERPRTQRSAGTTYEVSLAAGIGNARLSRQYRRLVENIVNEFPMTTGGTLFITGVAPTGHVADVAGQVAVELTRMADIDVLLVDADADRKVLTQRFAANNERGLSESLHEGTLASAAILHAAIARLRFLPFGNASLTRRTVAWQAVEGMLVDLRRTSRFVVLASDGCDSPLAEAVSRYADGSYLVVQAGRSENEQMSRSLASLTAAGARLLGCIATGVGE
jgi:Mrp family chromosome partitioning ATPase